MEAKNTIAFCTITFSHKGEINFTSALNIPIVFNPVLDETLNTATIKLTDLRQDDYPAIDVSKAFEPFSLVKIGFLDEEGNKQETEIRMVIAQDTCKMQRKDGTPWCSWSHNIQLVEETKQLERESVDVLTFTNPVERKYDSKASVFWLFDNNKSCYRNNFMGVVGKKEGDVDESNLTKYVGWQPPSMPMMINKTNSYTISSNLNTYNNNRTESYNGGNNISFLKLTVITPSNKSTTYEFSIVGGLNNKVYLYEDSYVTIPFNQVGEYKLEFFLRANTGRNDGTGNLHLTDIYYFAYIAVGSEQDQIHNYKISEVLNRTLDLTPTRTASENKKYQFDAAQLEEYSQEEAPEFAFTGHTLFEAMLQISGYKGAFPQMRTDDSGNKIISFRPLWNGVFKTAAELPEPIEEISLSDIEQYCTYLETEVQNLVGLNDSRKATLIEPYADGYKTTRSGAGSEISEDTVIIPTDYNIYQSIALKMGYTNGNIPDDGDITPYVYEQGEYEGLSDTNGAYPNSKAYAIKWVQMGKDYTELAHRLYKVDTLTNAFQRPTISNILYAQTGISDDSSLMTYLAKLVGIKDKDTFAELMFRSEYVPIFNARVKQYKDYFGKFQHDGSIKYNQTAELVDSEMYGEHLKQLIRKIGNAAKRCVYIFDKIDDVPKVGTVVDGYSVYDVQMSIRENEVVATISYVKYAELSQYIGVKNAWKDSDVSTNKCYNRAISYNEFLLFTHDGKKKSTSKAVTANALNKLLEFGNAEPLTCVEATGYYVDGSPLNTVLLPVVSLAMGNSLFFTWKYEDNYSAGYMSEPAPGGATNAISGTKYNRAQKAVKYCDMYGRMETYDFNILRTGPVPDGENIGWLTDAAEEPDYIVDTVARNIGYSLPLKPQEIVTPIKNTVNGEENTAYQAWTGTSFISVKDLLIEKNSSEALTFSVQLHYCADNENFIVGSGLTNFCSLVGGEARETGLFGFNERINIFKRRLAVSNAARLGNVNFTVNSSKRRIEITLPSTINNYVAWAYMGKDKNGNWQIIFGENRDLKGTDFETVLYLLPMHKLEDFI